jgi:methyl-accepting chemotaxis protein
MLKLFSKLDKNEFFDATSKLAALDRSQAIIEFDLDGMILSANSNFLGAMGYTLEEIKGKHHSLFVDRDYAASQEYRQFWDAMKRGTYQVAEYKRFAKGGKEIWIQASYNPLLDEQGKPYKVIKFATDITRQKIQNADYQGQLEAIDKSQAVISFHMDGTIIHANANFLGAVGYTLEEIKGKHHSMFVDPVYKNSPEYREFWASLGRGEYNAAEYKRFGKGGRAIYIQASYNPICDMNGKPYKVVKYATDTTQQVMTRLENERGASEAVEVLEAMSGGRLTSRMEGEYVGTFKDIKQAVNSTIDQLRDMVLQINDTAESVNSASSEISSGSSDLANRTEHQASSLEETAASMEQMTGTVRSNSENAASANKLSKNARDIAEKGGSVVNEAVTAMLSIEKYSQKISDIIGVIDEIAFQTNLLALNAAVEAARAGDAGKGFAVVASEVRALAGRSATASKEIKQLIVESAGQVKTGAVLVNQAGDTLREIVDSVRQVADIVSEISDANLLQTSGINEINTAIAHMDETTQQNAALVEENTAAAQSLSDQAASLLRMMQFFDVGQLNSASYAKPLPVKHESPKLSVAKPAAPVKAVKKTNIAPKKLSQPVAASASKSDDGWEEF